MGLYSAAGHPPLMRWRAESLERIESNGLLFRVMPDPNTRCVRCRWLTETAFGVAIAARLCSKISTRLVEIPTGCQPDQLGADQIRCRCIPGYF